MSVNKLGQQPVTDFGKHTLASVQEMRERARRHLESGAVTDEYGADRSEVVRILNEALATELICMLRYKSHYFYARGINSEAVKPEFLQHAVEAQQHANLIADFQSRRAAPDPCVIGPRASGMEERSRPMRGLTTLSTNRHYGFLS